MNGIACCLLIGYAVALVALSRKRRDDTPGHYLLDGRRLTLPAFVATLVTTWYGGILGVGEYAWTYGVSTWVVFGLPYYLAAIVFAFGLAARLRATGAASIPELLAKAYGPAAARTGAIGVLAFSLPVAYLVMLGVLLEDVTGWSRPVSVVIGAAFSALYVGLSGFRAVVRTDRLQMVLMYGGFLVLLPAAVTHTGGFGELWARLPETHRAWDGDLGWQVVAAWYLIAFQTVVDPTFYQRVFAATSPRVARRGVLVSVLFWAVFDFLTVTTGLAARVSLPTLDDPMRAYQQLAALVLPAGLSAVFVIGLFATVMSTVDSYLFLAASTVGHDVLPATARPSSAERTSIRWALWACAAIAAGGALLFRSAVAVWYGVGSVVTAALLVPVVGVHLPRRWRPSPAAAAVAMVASAATAVAWFALSADAGPYLGVEPMFPALVVAGMVWAADRLRS